MLKMIFAQGFLFFFTILNGNLFVPFVNHLRSTNIDCSSGSGLDLSRIVNPDSALFRKLGERIKIFSIAGDSENILRISDSLQASIHLHSTDTAYLSEIYYYSGVGYLLSEEPDKAMLNLNKCITAKEQTETVDENYLKALYNAGLTSFKLGNFFQSVMYLKEYITFVNKWYGPNSEEAAGAYSAMAGASIECIDYDGFLKCSFKALSIIGENPSALEGNNLCDLYTTIGVGYARMGDFAKAKLYLEKSESLTIKYNIPHDENYINLINSLAYTYGSLGLTDKEKEHYKMGIDLAFNNNSSLAFNLINSYAINTGESGNIKKGAELLSGIVDKAKLVYGIDSRLYIEVLNNYASYLILFNYETIKALEIYDQLKDYLSRHRNDAVMRQQVLSGFAKALQKNGRSEEALNIINDILYGKGTAQPAADFLINPVLDSIPADKSYLRIMQLKYEILWSLYNSSRRQEFLYAAAETSELIVDLIGKIRLSISEDESRLLLGDRYRDYYLFAIRDFELCFNKTGNRKFLEKAFEFAEKSKVAGLLAATRQMKATEFHIPKALSENEKTLQHEIAFNNSRIAAENEKVNPDKAMLSILNENLLSAVAARDSLVVKFERDFPAYYALKYSSRVPGINEIPSIIGRNYNYLNYVVSDSVLYIFLVNRKNQKLLTFKTDPSFIKSLEDFRNLLTDPYQSVSARTKFNNYQRLGLDLYKILIQPVEKYLISDNLLISPDNILSYLPFETFLSSKYDGSEILYRKLNYLMNDYNISYAYSATFIQETERSEFFGRNRLIAFAPSYPSVLKLDSLLTERQSQNLLVDLPFARQEAEYVAGITDGKLYLNDEAREALYKSEVAKYNIIHLAMHTVVNDQNPMNSAMVFSQVKDSTEDGLLYTYEVYGIPIRSKMVVLSSCNSGSGALSYGEGILSLARGFLYSGSQSVVMSLWKIEDRSGTDIIKMFYDNLEKGMSKSKALRKSRHVYLRKARQSRSHPYFWSTLVVFGNNSPVFIPWKKITGCSIIIVATALFISIYFKKRRYS